jgi:hypothetical protein
MDVINNGNPGANLSITHKFVGECSDPAVARPEALCRWNRL